jgi:nucleoid DNA-binding protein
MNQTQLTISIAKRFFLTQTEAGEIIKFILAEITGDLKKSKRISLRGFGSFNKEKRSSRKVRHPETGKIITIPERITVDFNPSESLIQNLT